MTAPEDTYWIRHLGLPFFYRHTPSRWVLRSVFYFGLLIAGGLLVFNLVILPYVFDEFTADSPVLLSQFYVMAILISCIFAPLISTFSLAGEKATGTMEFLRLAPLSPTAIVLGKTFAPVFVLHLLSVAFLMVGVVAGTAGLGTWATISDLVEGVVLILLHAVLLHSVGAFFSSLTSALRGFAAVIGVLAVMGFLHFMPLTLAMDQGTKVLSCFSPWGLMDALFWHEFGWGPRRPVQFLDSEKLAAPYLIAMNVAVSAILFRAAARRLDNAMRTALSPLGHMGLWALLLFTCLGIGLNDFRWGQAGTGWEIAAVIMGLVGTALIGFLIFDHPHRRDLVLSTACQRVSVGQPPGGSLRHLGHAVFAAMMALLSAILMVAFIAFANPLRLGDWGWVALVIGMPPLLSVLCCLLLEANQVCFVSAYARGAASTAGLALLAVILIAGAIDVGYTISMWEDCIRAARIHAKGPQPGWNYWEQRYSDLSLRYPERMACLETPEEVDTTAQSLREWPVFFFLRHHPMRTVFHLGLFGAYVAGLIGWRWRAYYRIRKEARDAVKGATDGGEPHMNTDEH